MADASKKYVEENSQVAWIDFGFEHGGEVFEDENDYSFLWEYDFGNKITLFYKNEITTDPIFKIIKTFQPDCILGSLIVAPKSLCEQFWKINLESANILADIGFMDDDQLIYLLSYRRNPELFNLVKSDWFLALKQCGGGHIKLKKIQKPSFLSRVKNKIKNIFKKHS